VLDPLQQRFVFGGQRNRQEPGSGSMDNCRNARSLAGQMVCIAAGISGGSIVPGRDYFRAPIPSPPRDIGDAARAAQKLGVSD
jgi:hypothetical protein